MPLNPNQLSTMEQAEATAQRIGTIGGGVREIYSIPNIDNDEDFRHYKLGNGAEGINAGLCRITIENNPESWEEQLSADFARAAEGESSDEG